MVVPAILAHACTSGDSPARSDARTTCCTRFVYFGAAGLFAVGIELIQTLARFGIATLSRRYSGTGDTTADRLRHGRRTEIGKMQNRDTGFLKSRGVACSREKQMLWSSDGM